MKVLIVGFGSIGQRHLANLRRIDATAQVTIWHQHTDARDVRETLQEVDRRVYRLEDALETRPDVALITGPASLHVKTGLDLAAHDIGLFIEKPISNELDGVDELLELCRERSLVLMLGYVFRFYRPLKVLRQALIEGKIGRPLILRAEVGQYLPDWRPGKDYHHCVSARQDLGGGAVLELSHELDYARWLLGEVKSVNAHLAQLGDLDIDVEDAAEIILQFNSRAIGSIHLDMIQRPATRMCRIIGTEGTLTWDGSSHRVQLFSVTSNRWEDLHPANTINQNKMYEDELRHFLDCFRGKAEPIVSGEDGKRALEIALAAKRSSQSQRVVYL